MKFLLLLLSVLCIYFASATRFERVHVVDVIKTSTTTNYLIRGDVPVQNGSFDYDNLMQYIRTRLNEKGERFPEDPYLIDVSFMNMVDEDKVEIDFWANGKNSDKGEFLVWSMGFAGTFRPSSYSVDQQNEMAKEQVWDVDQLPTRVPEMIKMLKEDGPKNAQGKVRSKIYYVHCKAGCDRTGEFVFAYRMFLENKSNPQLVQQLLRKNVDECGRAQNWFGHGGNEWYCIYLSNLTGFNFGKCIDQADCILFKGCTWPIKN